MAREVHPSEDLSRHGGPARFRVDGSTYIPSVTPRGLPAFMSYGGLVEGLITFLWDALFGRRLGYTVQVRRYRPRALTFYRSVLRRHFETEEAAEACRVDIVNDLRHHSLAFLTVGD